MSSTNSIQNNSYFTQRGFGEQKHDKKHALNSDFIKHQLHEKKIDEFFWTNAEAPHERFSAHSLIGSLMGVVIPTVLLGKKQHPGLKINSFKNFFKSMNIEYGIKEILAVGVGGVIGGLAGGLADKNEKGKLDKIQEATFQTMNISLPALFVGGLTKLCEKSPKFNKPAPKLAVSALGMLSGAYLAVKLANKVDNKIFDRYNIDPDRKFKAKDFAVHIDDVFGALVLAKVPFVDKLHINKILPAIFTWSGFHVGES